MLASRVILERQVLAYDELSDEERTHVSPNCCSYSRTGGWMSADRESFGPEKGYFVRAVIDPTTLAQRSFLHSCGGVTYARTCSPAEFRDKVTAAMNGDTPHRVYGKYQNQWVMLANGVEIPRTEKFDGHHLIRLRRSGTPPRDSVLIGPMPERPDRLRIRLYHSAPDGVPPSPDPEVSLPQR